jgi:2-polyprenyl-6-methoxyphenol hydroxylase-like FAD-dependent oxidoreductase
MLFLRTLFILISCSLSNHLLCREEPLSIVIIGGGPAGLAAAIEANEAGANVIIVEKREQHTREQFVFLLEPALNLLNKWKVSIPEMFVGIDDGEKIGLTKIKNMEVGLSKRVHELGITKIFGEFTELNDGKAIIAQQNQKLELPYDLLVGADGTHSFVRDALKITSNLYGQTQGLIAIIPMLAKNESMEFISPIRCGSLFINKIIIPSAVIVSAQGDELSKEILASAAMQNGWQNEAASISSGQARFFENVEVVLQQSAEFSNREKSAILLGDAAASASFIQGLGANCALETAMIAGLFFKTEQKDSDYAAFNQAMQIATDRLTKDSAFLFK